jgi:hypothetical protein
MLSSIATRSRSDARFVLRDNNFESYCQEFCNRMEQRKQIRREKKKSGAKILKEGDFFRFFFRYATILLLWPRKMRVMYKIFPHRLSYIRGPLYRDRGFPASRLKVFSTAFRRPQLSTISAYLIQSRPARYIPNIHTR